MLIISVRDNENNSLKRKEKTNKETNSEKNKAGRGGGAIVKGWELNDFLKQLSCSVFFN